MSSTPKSQRSPTKFEAEHHFFALRDSVTELALQDFGFSEKKYLAKIEKFRESFSVRLWASSEEDKPKDSD